MGDFASLRRATRAVDATSGIGSASSATRHMDSAAGVMDYDFSAARRADYEDAVNSAATSRKDAEMEEYYATQNRNARFSGYKAGLTGVVSVGGTAAGAYAAHQNRAYAQDLFDQMAKQFEEAREQAERAGKCMTGQKIYETLEDGSKKELECFKQPGVHGVFVIIAIIGLSIFLRFKSSNNTP